MGLSRNKDIELVHCKFLRKLLCVRKSTNLERLYGEIERHPLKIQRKLSLIKYWMKILNTNNPIIKNADLMMKGDAEINGTYGGNNWAFQIKNILMEIGMNNIWQSQN